MAGNSFSGAALLEIIARQIALESRSRTFVGA
jgi:hypothetical protein